MIKIYSIVIFLCAKSTSIYQDQLNSIKLPLTPYSWTFHSLESEKSKNTAKEKQHKADLVDAKKVYDEQRNRDASTIQILQEQGAKAQCEVEELTVCVCVFHTMHLSIGHGVVNSNLPDIRAYFLLAII